MRRAISVCFALCLGLFSQSTVAQIDLTQIIGAPENSHTLPVRLGFVNLDNGNLHLEIPLYTQHWRGHPDTTVTLNYDSIFWNQWPLTGGPEMLYPTNAGWSTGSIGSDSIGATYGSPSSTVNCSTIEGDLSGQIYVYTSFTATDPHGTTHRFRFNSAPIGDAHCYYTNGVGNYPGDNNTTIAGLSQVGSAYAADGSGYRLTVTKANYIQSETITNAHGTGTNTHNAGDNEGTDPNGNTYDITIGLVDQLGSPYPTLTGITSINHFYSNTSNYLSFQPYAAKASVAGAWSRSAFNENTGSVTPANYTFSWEYIPVCTGTTAVDYCGGMWVLGSLGLPDGTSYTFSYDQGTSAGHLGKLTGITLPTGGQISYSYGGPLKCGAILCGGLIGSVEDNGGTTTFSFGSPGLIPGIGTYGPWTYYPLTVTYPAHLVTAGSSQSIQDQTLFSASAYTFTKTDYSGTSLPLRTTTTTTDQYGRAGSVKSVWPATNESHEVDYKYADDPSVPGTMVYGQTGINLVALTSEYDSGTLVRKVQTTYQKDTSSTSYVSQYNMINYPSQVQLLKPDGSVESQVQYTYDEYSAGYCTQSYPKGLSGIAMLTSVTGASGHDDTNYGTSFLARGNPTTTIYSGANVANAITTHRCYDTLGNVTQAIDGNSKATRYDYTDNFYERFCISSASTLAYAFPTSFTDALGHKSMMTYYSCNREPRRSISPNDTVNGRTGTIYHFDTAFRPTCTSFPDGGSVCASYPNANEIDVSTLQNSSGTKTLVKSGLDSFGNSVQQVNESSGVEVDTTYDAFGRVNGVSTPHLSSVSPTGSTQFAYDAFGRKTSLINPDGSAESRLFTGNTVLSTDEQGDQWKTQRDSLGRIAKVWEPNGAAKAPSMETDYTPDVLGNVVGVTQWGGAYGSAGARTRAFTYDGLSRLLTASNPESGLVSYSYDADGNVHTRTDARGIVTTYSYDDDERTFQRAYSDGVTPSAAYGYDGNDGSGNPIAGLQNAIGQVSFATNWVNAASSFSYDPMGRIIKKSSCVPGDCSYDINVVASYDYAGNLTSMTNGVSNPAVSLTYQYDSANRLSLLTSSWNDSKHPLQLFSAPSYGAMGLSSAQIGTDSSNNSTLFLARSYDSRGRISLESDATSRVQTSPGSPSSGSIAVNLSEQSKAGTPGVSGRGTVTISGSERVVWVNTPGCIGPRSQCAFQAYDGGTVSLAANGYTKSASYGTTDSTGTIATALANAFNSDGASPVTASASGAVITLTAKVGGTASNYTWSVVGQTQSSYFTGTSFSASPVSGALTGGINGGAPTYDAGTIIVTINGSTTPSVNWGNGSSSGSVAADLTTAIQSTMGSFLSASHTQGSSSISLQSLAPSTASDWPISYIITHDSTDFPSSSLSTTPSGMSFGQDPQYNPQTAYGYTVPSGGYAGNGNLNSVIDSVTGQWSYTYDTLNRLLTGTPSTGPDVGSTYCWAYDSFGNKTAESRQTVACPAQSSVTANASYNLSNRVSWTSIHSATNGFGYDLSGDVTNDNLYGYLYDAEGRVCAVQSLLVPSVMTGYIYDADGNRVARGTLTSFSCNLSANHFSTANRYVIGLNGEQLTELDGSGNWSHTNVFAGGKLLATYHDTDTYFALNDWTGTKRGVVTPDGQKATYYSLPYGDGPVASGTATDATEHHFTGKERDTESGNDYFGARYYGSSMGRFMSPDWSAKYEPVPYAKLDDPQSLNLYAYVRNNPLSRADLDGHSDYLWQKTKNWVKGDGFKTDAQVKGLSVAQTAASHKDSMDWGIHTNNSSGKDVGHPQDFHSGQDKCNQFVGDTLAEAGKTRPEITDANGNTRMPNAHEMADPSVHIPGLSDTKPLSEAQPGDVIAQQHGDVYGHTGIVVGPGQTASANATGSYDGQITINNWGFRPAGGNGESGTDPAPVVRTPQ